MIKILKLYPTKMRSNNILQKIDFKIQINRHASKYKIVWWKQVHHLDLFKCWFFYLQNIFTFSSLLSSSISFIYDTLCLILSTFCEYFELFWKKFAYVVEINKFLYDKKGEGTSPEQEQLVHNLLHSGGKFLY